MKYFAGLLTFLFVLSMIYSVHLSVDNIDSTSMRVLADNYRFFIAQAILSIATWLSVWSLVK